MTTTLILAAALTGVTGAALAEPIVTAFDDDGAILVNGKRTLILGTYHYGNKYTKRPDGELLAELAEAGFNLVRTGSGADIMDKAAAAGLMTWTSVGTLDLEKREESAKALTDKVNAIKGHPALAFIESVDEPAWTWQKAEQRIPAGPFVEAYPIIKAADPNHLLYMNHAPTNLVKTMRAYNGGTDIVAMDIYPVNPGGLMTMYALFEDGLQGDLNNTYISQVGEYVDKMRRVTGPNRPLFMVLQGFAWEMLNDEKLRRQEKVLYPSYEETRFMAYQSLIKGANGIIYWGSAYTPQPSDCWTGIKRVVREIADLSAPLVVKGNAAGKVTADYHEMGHSVDDGVQMLGKLYDGKLYLFTCNADKNRCKATLAGLDGWTACRVLNEARDNASLPVENGVITDVWPRFGVHVYELSK